MNFLICFRIKSTQIIIKPTRSYSSELYKGVGDDTVQHALAMFPHLGQDAFKVIDTDGDGKFTSEDIKAYWRGLKKLLTQGLPSSSGFVTGFVVGVKYL